MLPKENQKNENLWNDMYSAQAAFMQKVKYNAHLLKSLVKSVIIRATNFLT